jgi:membrane protein DedA with SNARE-associated domain
MPDINHILENHRYLPYLILLVWTFLEGETIVIIAGIAAREGHPWLPLVMVCAFCGSLCSDQLMFFLGRYKGKAFIAKRPRWQIRAEKVYRMLEKHQTWLILGFRFLYGIRNITPLAIGMSGVSVRRFVILNIIGAAVWSISFSISGYLFGAAMETFLAKEHKILVILSLLVLAALIWIVRAVRRRAIQKNNDTQTLEQKNV